VPFYQIGPARFILSKLAGKRKVWISKIELYFEKHPDVRFEGYIFTFSERMAKTGGTFDDREFGKFLGYPDCCVKRYCEKDGKSFPGAFMRYKEQLAGRPDLLGLQLIQVDLSKFIKVDRSKVPDTLFGHIVGKVSWIPCSPRCAETIKIAARIYNELCSNKRKCKLKHVMAELRKIARLRGKGEPTKPSV